MVLITSVVPGMCTDDPVMIYLCDDKVRKHMKKRRKVSQYVYRGNILKRSRGFAKRSRGGTELEPSWNDSFCLIPIEMIKND